MRYYINRDSDTVVIEHDVKFYAFGLAYFDRYGPFEPPFGASDPWDKQVEHFGELVTAKSANGWLEEFPVQILDPDGWRGVNALSFDALITRREFAERVYISTVENGDALKQLLEIENPVKWTADR